MKKRDKPETCSRRNREFYERQKERFIPMRAMIEEISESVEPEYIRVSIHESDARIALGRKNKNGRFEEDVRWEIEPNYELQPPWKDYYLRCEQAGFRIEERVAFRSSDDNTHEHIHSFNDEQAVAEYLVKKMAEKIGSYRHPETKPKK
jgi:hypothetical protein